MKSSSVLIILLNWGIIAPGLGLTAEPAAPPAAAPLTKPEAGRDSEAGSRRPAKPHFGRDGHPFGPISRGPRPATETPPPLPPAAARPRGAAPSPPPALPPVGAAGLVGPVLNPAAAVPPPRLAGRLPAPALSAGGLPHAVPPGGRGGGVVLSGGELRPTRGLHFTATLGGPARQRQ